jgi:hypothetical protein
LRAQFGVFVILFQIPTAKQIAAFHIEMELC